MSGEKAGSENEAASPITRFSMKVHHRDDVNIFTFDPIHDSIRKTFKTYFSGPCVKLSIEKGRRS